MVKRNKVLVATKVLGECRLDIQVIRYAKMQLLLLQNVTQATGYDFGNSQTFRIESTIFRQ